MWSVSVLKEREDGQEREDGVRRVLGDLEGLEMFEDWRLGRKG